MTRVMQGYVDLHLHLDGSLSPEMIVKQAKKDDIVIPETKANKLRPYIEANNNITSLNEYLECFNIPLLVLQTQEGIYEAVRDLSRRLLKNNVFYAEIRYAPSQHTRRGLTQEDAVKAVIHGMNKAMEEQEIMLTSILCCMRGEKETTNMETISIAKKYLGNGVSAVDLAGAEALYPIELYQELFRYAASIKIPYVIHAGEAADAKSVAKAIELGASRIGHGIHAMYDDEVMSELARRKIPLELCPTSNLQTKAIKNIAQYPLRTFMERGIITTINTDNMTVSATSVAQEFEWLKTYCGLTDKEEQKLKKNAVESAFMDIA